MEAVELLARVVERARGQETEHLPAFLVNLGLAQLKKVQLRQACKGIVGISGINF